MKRGPKNRAAAIACALMLPALAACGGNDRWYASADAARSAGSTVDGLRAVVNATCPVSGKALKSGESALGGAVLSALLVSAVDVGLKSLGAALAEAGSDKTAFFPARTSYDFYSLPGVGGDPAAAASIEMNSDAGCLIVYLPAAPPRGFAQWQTDTVRTSLEAIGLKTAADFYFEASFEVSGDRSSFRMVPQALYYANNLFASPWRSQQRDLVVTFDWSKPGAKAGESVAADKLTFLGAKPDAGRLLRNEDLATVAMSYQLLPAVEGRSLDILNVRKTAIGEYIPLAAPADAELARLQAGLRRANDALQESAWKDGERRLQVAVREAQRGVDRRTAALKLAALKDQTSGFGRIDLQPVNLQVFVAETAEGSALLKKMGEILAGASPSINASATAAVKERFDPETRAKAEKDAVDATNRAELAILTAEKAVSESRRALAALSADASAEARAVAEADLRIAQFNANVAYQAAGRSIRYPDARP